MQLPDQATALGFGGDRRVATSFSNAEMGPTSSAMTLPVAAAMVAMVSACAASTMA